MPPETKASRSRTGCLTCRKRHLKCNEHRPRCNRCTASNRPCEYPAAEPATPDIDHDPWTFPEAQPWLQQPKHLSFVSEVFIPPGTEDQDEVLQRTNQHIQYSLPQQHQQYEAETKTETRLAAHHRRRRRHSSMHSMRTDTGFFSESLPSPTSTSSDRDEGDMAFGGPEISLFLGSDYSGGSPVDKGTATLRSVYIPGPYKPIEDPHVSQMLQYYMHNIAPWLDLTDPLCHFARRVPHMAIRCPMLQDAILALVSSRITRVDKPGASSVLHTTSSSLLHLDPLTPVRHYGACMSLLIRALEAPEIVGDEAIPVTTVILHTYEIFEGHLDSQKHLKGTMSVFAHQRHRLRRPGIRRTTFWTYVRQEIIVALRARRPTNIHVEAWQGDMYWGEDSDDAWANRMSWLMVKVINFYFRDHAHDHDDGRRATEEAARFFQHEVTNWRDQAPLTLGPLCTLESGVCDEEPFPVISYTCLWHFIGMQFYHLACMLLAMKCSGSSGAEGGTGPDSQTLWHAHQICGAAVTLGKRSHGAMINSIGPLIVCGQILTKPSERMRLLNLLTEIGAVTGWPVSDETANLLREWSVA